MNAIWGACVFGFFVCGLIGAGRWFLIFVSRMRGRKSMARYVDTWPVTRA